MDLLTFFLLLLVAAIAAGLYQLITGGWSNRTFAALFVAFAAVLVLPALLPRLIGG
jgi:hypothetical protein